MPRIDLITRVTYDALWPYHSRYDNLPLTHILARQSLINSAVDNQDEILDDAKGTAGTLANRLNQSIAEDGSLIADAVDETLHNIGAHTDGTYEGTDYVRMTASERDKLELIADEATALIIQFETVSTTAEFSNETILIQDSDTITWEIESPNVIRANMVFPDSAAHEHHYGLTPVHSNLSEPDYTNYKITSSPSLGYIEGSLRVYVNGIRISEDEEIYIYNNDDGPNGDWEVIQFTGDFETGLFELSRAIDDSDIIKIDFDRSFV
jgi:hypothetical protein